MGFVRAYVSFGVVCDCFVLGLIDDISLVPVMFG